MIHPEISTVLDSGRRPQHDGIFAFRCTILEVDAGERGSPSALVHEEWCIYIYASSRMDWVAVHGHSHPLLPAAVGRAAASMQTESPAWSSWRHDGSLPLLVSRRAEPAAQPLVHETSMRAVDPFHVSVCKLKKLGRAVRL